LFKINGNTAAVLIDYNLIPIGSLRLNIWSRVVSGGEMIRILLIEDDVAVLEMLKKTLEREGYQVTTASNGRIGIREYNSQSFDVVITDLIMPDMEGMETIISLRKDNPDVKIIAMSGGGLNNPDEYLDVAKKLGAIKAFEKPLRRQVLLDAVAELTS
jgi:CheY-like chemotaxis protein